MSTLQFTWIWNDFLWPLIFTQSDDKRTIMIGIVNLKGQYSVAWGVQGALSLVASLPTLLVFLFFQRFFIKGMTMGAVKDNMAGLAESDIRKTFGTMKSSRCIDLVRRRRGVCCVRRAVRLRQINNAAHDCGAGINTTSGKISLIDHTDIILTCRSAKRGIAMVFQSYALFPHMTVAENISFGLRLQRFAPR